MIRSAAVLFWPRDGLLDRTCGVVGNTAVGSEGGGMYSPSMGLLSAASVCCVNRLTPNDHYSGRTVPLASKRCILYIYSTDIGTEYFKHGIYSPFFFSSKCSLLHNSNVFGSCIIHILYTVCAKIKKKIIPAPKG